MRQYRVLSGAARRTCKCRHDTDGGHVGWRVGVAISRSGALIAKRPIDTGVSPLGIPVNGYTHLISAKALQR